MLPTEFGSIFELDRPISILTCYIAFLLYFLRYHDNQILRQSDDTISLTLEVISTEPRMFLIEDFLSHGEVEHLIGMTDMMNLMYNGLSDRKRYSFVAWKYSFEQS